MVEHVATHPEAVTAKPQRKPKRHHRLKRRKAAEVGTAIVLAVGGVLSAWAGFQSSLWDGQQASAYAESEALRVRAAQASTLAGQLANIDASTFTSWAAAGATHQTEFQQFLSRRFRPEFKPVFDAWLALDPAHNAEAPATPLQMPGYKPKALRDSEALTAEADALRSKGNEANASSDLYGRATIMFALSLFLAGIAGQFRHVPVRAAVLFLSAAFVAVGVAFMLTLPRAMPG